MSMDVNRGDGYPVPVGFVPTSGGWGELKSPVEMLDPVDSEEELRAMDAAIQEGEAAAEEPGTGELKQAVMELAEGPDAWWYLPGEIIFKERQESPRGNKLAVTLDLRGKNKSRAVTIDMPPVLTPGEAEILKGMLDRAVKAEKAVK
jgi:hypothetical protein